MTSRCALTWFETVWSYYGVEEAIGLLNHFFNENKIKIKTRNCIGIYEGVLLDIVGKL
jgi:hypothetical protein